MGTYNPNCNECKAREEADRAREQVEKKNQAEYDKGYFDALEGKDCSPSSISYVSGYRHGQRSKNIRDMTHR